MTELATVEDHPVEAGSRLQRLEGAVGQPGLALLGLGARQQLTLGGEEVALVVHDATEDVVTLLLHQRGVLQQRRHAGQEDRGRLASTPRADEAADRLGEEQRCGRGRRVDADGQPRDVDAFAAPSAPPPASAPDDVANFSMTPLAFGSSERTVGTFSPQIRLSSRA